MNHVPTDELRQTNKHRSLHANELPRPLLFGFVVDFKLRITIRRQEIAEDN